MKDNETLYIECDCGHNDHLFKMTYSTSMGKDWPATVFTSIQLNPVHPWYTRIWLAVRYVFGADSRYGHWDCTSLTHTRVKMMYDFLGECLKDMEKPS